MTYHVLLKHRPEGGYRATVLAWPGCVGEGATKREALAQVRDMLVAELCGGEVVPLEVPGPMIDDPWEQIIGQFAEDSQWDMFQEELQRIRNEGKRTAP